MKWKITYYNGRVKEALEAWPDKLLAHYLRIIDMIETYGPNLGLPFTRAMGDGLFEIRTKIHQGIGRVFFKKTNETPQKELAIARRRMKEVSL